MMIRIAAYQDESNGAEIAIISDDGIVIQLTPDQAQDLSKELLQAAAECDLAEAAP